jgi:hypothetical protein
MLEFPDQQLKDFKAFERVRASGHYNMFDPKAMASAKLDKTDYLFVMKNYTELHDAVKGKSLCSKI